MWIIRASAMLIGGLFGVFIYSATQNVAYGFAGYLALGSILLMLLRIELAISARK